jgi:hypothetical protein
MDMGGMASSAEIHHWDHQRLPRHLREEPVAPLAGIEPASSTLNVAMLSNG